MASVQSCRKQVCQSVSLSVCQSVAILIMQLSVAADMTKRSKYQNILSQYDAAEVLKNLHPWGCGMFCGDIVESLNYIFKNHFLCSSARGGGKGTSMEGDRRLVTQALERLFLAKEMPRWQRVNAD